MPDFKPLGEWDFSNASDCWDTWKQRFLRYRSASGLEDKPQQRQVDALIYTMGPEAERIVNQISVRDVTGDEVAADPLLSELWRGLRHTFTQGTIHYTSAFCFLIEYKE